MKRNHFIIAVLLPIIFSSCSITDIGMEGIFAIFGVMLILFGVMLFFIFKKRRQADKSLAKFSYNVQEMLKKFDTTEEKIDTLNFLIERIYDDPHYQKDTAWRDQVLVKAYLFLAGLYHKMGDEGQTLNVCTRIIEIDPNEWMTLYNRGTIYSNMGLYEKAIHDLNEAIRLMPIYANAYNNRGLVYDKLGRYEEAIENYNEALKNEETATCYYNRANAYYALERYEEALEDCNSYMKMSEGENDKLKKSVELTISEIEKRLNGYTD